MHHYPATFVCHCNSCLASATPSPNRRVSLTSLNKSFNGVLRDNHVLLGFVTLLRVIDVATRFSAAGVVQPTVIGETIIAFESL